MSDSQERDQRPVFGDRSGSQEPFGSYARRKRKERQTRPTDPYTNIDLRERLPDLVEAPQEEPTPDGDPADWEVEMPAEEAPPEQVAHRSLIDEVAEGIPIEEKDYAPPPEPEPEPDPEPSPEPRRRQITLQPGLMLRSSAVMVLTAAFVATMFTWWTPNAFLSPQSLEQLSVAQATQAAGGTLEDPVAALEEAAGVGVEVTPTPTYPPPPPPELNRVGIVAGHAGIYPPTGLPDPGAVCDDGLTEREINESVAAQVAALLEGHGYEVDVLEEFDARLTGYRARAMVSIHADSCTNYGPGATGYKVASFSYSANPAEDDKLVRCLSERYQETTELPFHPSITFDMTEYHNFREIDPSTPGAIIELGFMFADRQILTEGQDVIALGVARGVLCYLRDELPPIVPPSEEPTP
jgi:N-acetylmuramoyl-L-alanine amidase